MADTTVVPIERVEQSILLIRGQKVMLDVDLADLYQVTTKQLNQQVRRNKDRFPSDFMFQLTDHEKREVVTDCDHLKDRLKFSPHLPYAFTEHGALMLANVVKSPSAIQASIHVVRAFVKLRALLETHEQLARKLKELEARYDGQFAVVFEALKELMAPPTPKRKPVGFLQDRS
ncbi:MAG: ORF6N domain-containing protein [Candidatus Aquicultorales bacterium]